MITRIRNREITRTGVTDCDASNRPDGKDGASVREQKVEELGKESTHDGVAAQLVPNLKVLDSGPEFHLKRARVWMEMEDLNEAVSEIEAALSGDSTLYWARFMRAEIHLQQGDDEGALSEYRKSIELHPRFAEGYQRLADFHALRGRYEEAITLYKRALGFNKDLLLGRLNLGFVYFKTRDTRKALKQYREAIRIEPRLGEGGHMLGDYYVLFETVLRCGVLEMPATSLTSN